MATVRELITKIGFNLDDKGIVRAEQLVGSFKTTALAATAVITSAAAGLAAMAVSAAHAGDEILKTSERTGLTVREVQRLQYAAKIADISAEDFTLSMKFLNRALAAAKGGSEEAVEAFRKVGVDPRRAELSEALLERMADGFQSVKSQAEKVGLTLRFFGRSGERWLTVLKDGGVGIRDLGDTLEMFGLLTKEQIEALAEFDDQMKGIRARFALLKNIIGAALIPSMKKLLDQFQKWLAQNKERVIEAIIGSAQVLATVFQVLVDVVGLLTTGFKGLSDALGSSTAALWTVVAVGVALGLAFGWLDIIVIAVYALIGAFLLLYEDLKGFESGKKSLFNWGPAIDAVTFSVNALSNALSATLKLMKLIWAVGTLDIKKIPKAASDLYDAVSSNVQGLGVAGSGAMAFGGGAAAVARMGAAPVALAATGRAGNTKINQKVEVNVRTDADPDMIAEVTAKKTREAMDESIREADRNIAAPDY